MRKLAIALALSSTLLASPALARDGAVYVGGEFGAMIAEDMDVDVGATEDAITLNYDYGYDGGLFLGYDFGGFRLEVEGAYKKARLEEFQTSIPLPGQCNSLFPNCTNFATIGDAGGGNTSVMSLMLNGMLDFGDDDGVTGFIGGGVGFARVKLNNMRAFANTGAFLDDRDTRLAWQVIAGVRQAISDNMDVTVKYRFFNVDNLRLVAGTVGSPDAEARFRSHSLLGGITFNFGGVEEVEVACPAGWTRDVDGECQAPPARVEPVVVPQTRTCPNGTTIPADQECPRPVVGPFIVFFEWDKDDITPQASAILDNAASAYQQTGQAQVMLAGHADRSGSDQYNVGLSQRRAANVRAYLAGRGIPDGVMTTEAFGESRPLVETADGVREPQNRRVEISFGPGSGW